MKQSIVTGRFACNYKSENERLCNCNEVKNEVLVCFIVIIIVIFEKFSIFKSLCMSQRLLVLQRILSFFSYYYCYYYSSPRQNLVRTSPPTLLKKQFCHLAHIFI